MMFASRTHRRLAFAALLLVASSAACLFVPKIEDTGYVACTTDDDCVPGRYCGFEICAPPDWAEPSYRRRQHLVVENPGETPLLKGTAIPVEVGAGGTIPLANFDGLSRFATYDATEGWVVQSGFYDRYADRFVAYLPLPEDLPAGARTSLAWIESDFSGDSSVDPEQSGQEDTSVFDAFFGFEPEAVVPDGGPAPEDAGVADAGPPPAPEPVVREFDGDDTFRLFNGPATIRDGVLTLRDNQQMSARLELLPPFRVTFKGRFNNTTCSRVYFGLRGQTGNGYAAPSAEFSVGGDLDGVLEIAPGEGDSPTPASSPVALDNRIRRYSIDVTQSAVRADIDGEPFAAADNLRPGFADDVPLYLVFDIDGNNCSFDLEELRVTHTGIPSPVVTAEDPIEYVAYQAP